MFHRLVAQAAYGFNGKLGIILKTLAKPVNVYIDGIVVRLGFHAPYLIHELDTGEYLAGIGQELVKKIEFLAGQRLAFIPSAYGQGVVIQAHICDGDAPFVQSVPCAEGPGCAESSPPHPRALSYNHLFQQ